MDPSKATAGLADSEKQTSSSVLDRAGTPPATVGDQAPVRLDPYGIPLYPPPTDDPKDMLNWSHWRKYVILIIVCYGGLLGVYMTGTPIESFYLLEEQFNATYSQVNWTVAIPSLGLAIGPLLFNSYADIYGRHIVFISSAALTMLATGLTTIRSINYGGYMFCRFLQGVGAGPMTAVGFSVIRDMAWEHERGWFVGMWVMAIDVGGVLGSLIGGFTAATGPFWANYHVAIAYGVILLLSIFCLPETLYPREAVLCMTAEGESYSTMLRTTDIKPWNVIKIPGVHHPKPWQATVRFVQSWAHPRLVLGLLPYVFLQYWWIMSLLTMEPAAYYMYSTQIQGLLFLGLIIGTVLAELLVSGRLSDIIVSRIAARSSSKARTPEMRLYLGYPGAILGAVGCILWGISVDRQWHWITGQVAFVLFKSRSYRMFSAGMQLGNSAVSTYIFDCYPNHIIEIMTFYTVVFNISAFVEPWFINYWVEDVGYTWCFVTQGLITLLLIPAYMALQVFGGRMAKEMKF